MGQIRYETIGRRRLIGWMAAAMLLPAAQPALAGQGVTMAARSFVERVETDLNGRARRVLAQTGQTESGDQVITVIDWRNDSGQPLRGFTLTRPLPSHARFDTAVRGMTVSVDGGSRWGRLDQLWLPTPLGGVRRATPDDVTHIRWRTDEPIAPGAGGRVSYRVTVR